MALLERKLAALAPPPPSRRPTAPPTRSPPASPSRCAASSRRCSAPTASSPAPATSSATPPTPAPTGCFPQAVVMAHDADDVAKVLAYGRAQRHPGHLPRRRHQPQRPGPERRHPGRRPPPLRRRRGRGRTARWPGSSRARCSATPTACSPRTAASSAPTRPAPTSPRVGGVIANNSGGMRCGVDQGLLLDRALADLRPALGDDDRHRRAGRRRALRRGASRSWPPASPRSATRSAPTPS